MTATHFFRDDLVSTLLATGLFSLFSVPLGYLLGWVTGLLDFRRQSLAWRLVISIPLSLSACPIVAYWLDRIGGPLAVWGAFSVCWATFLGVFVSDARRGEIHFGLPSKTSVPFLLLALAWAALAFSLLVDLPRGNDGLYLSVTVNDQIYRTAYTDAITRTGISTPVNPLNYLDGPAPLRYHYFWFILCSLVDQAGGAWVTARYAYFASVIWCGIGLGCAIAAYLRFFVRSGDMRGWTLKGILLLTVTGLDIIPTFTLAYFRHIRYQDMEGWNEAVTSWLGSLLWVPHNVGALIAGVTGFLIVFHAPGLDRLRQRWMSAVVAGMLLATMLGDSVYVGLVMAVFLGVWTLLTLVLGWSKHTALLVITGLVTVALALPYLISLSGPAGGGGFVQFTVRDFHGAVALGLPTEFPHAWQTYLLRMALLPVNYLFELGFFLVTGILYLNRLWVLRKIEPASLAGVALVVSTVAVCTFLKSGTIANNDLGWRGFLPAQFMLLIWAIEFLAFRDEKWAHANWLYTILDPLVPLLLVVGIVSTAYSLTTLRLDQVFNDVGTDHGIPRRNFAARRVYEQLRSTLLKTAVIQQNPAQNQPVYWGIYANRQTAAAGATCGVEFGGTAPDCAQLYPGLAALFQSGDQMDVVVSVCRRWKIDALVVTNGDPVWSISDSWIWKNTPLVATDGARAFLMNPAILAEAK